MTTTLRLTGIVSTSRHYTGLAGVAVHELVLTQPSRSDALPTLARREFDATPASHLIAQRLAHQFRTGHRATVHATAWRFNQRRHMVELVGVDHAELLPSQQPTEAEACA
jgi:hypothetical protein